ncbi:MAG: ROK family protein [Homoserinimonas sp.]
MIEPVVLAVDLGGSSMKGAVVTVGGLTVGGETRRTPGSAIVDALVDLLRELRSNAEALGHTVIGAGVVTPGIVNEDTGVVLYASNLDWRDLPLLDILQSHFPFPVAVGHDVRAAGRAEHLLGAARGAADFVLLPIGTGVAAALITDSTTVTGATGAAGEVGHIPVVPGGELCTCGQRGCLEVYVSGAGLSRRYRQRTGRELSAQQIVQLLGTDSAADEVWHDAVRVLAQGLAIMTLMLDPRIIVLGGGFSNAGEVLLSPVRAALKGGLTWRDTPEVVLSELGGEAGRIGAAILAVQAAGEGAVVGRWSSASLAHATT